MLTISISLKIDTKSQPHDRFADAAMKRDAKIVAEEGSFGQISLETDRDEWIDAENRSRPFRPEEFDESACSRHIVVGVRTDIAG
jgi:hypothetical protein